MTSRECGICSFLKQGIKRDSIKRKESHLLQGGKFCSNKKSIYFRVEIKSLYSICSEFEGVLK